MNTDTFVIYFQNMSYYFWMTAWMNNVNNFQIVKVQPQGAAQHLLGVSQFQPDVADESVAYKNNM